MTECYLRITAQQTTSTTTMQGSHISVPQNILAKVAIYCFDLALEKVVSLPKEIGEVLKYVKY